MLKNPIYRFGVIYFTFKSQLQFRIDILEAYAKEKGFTVVGESYDDNVSGMHFNREGIERLQDEVEKGTIDAVVVKDLSRLGRHRTQTAMFIDYLRQHRGRVLSVTENIDADNEDDELMIGFKGIFNDIYCRDISKKIRAGFMQKQREGIVIIPPMGYYKERTPVRSLSSKSRRRSFGGYTGCILKATGLNPSHVC